MLPHNHPDRVRIAFDDHRLVNNAGLIFRPPWPCTSAFPNWYRCSCTRAMRRAGPTPATRS